MTWLDAYNQYQLDRIISALDSLETTGHDPDRQLVLLDDVLDIWFLPPDAWSDPDLSNWSAILNRQPPYDTEESQRHITDEIYRLREQVRHQYARLAYQRMLDAIGHYLNGTIHPGTLESRLWSEVTAIEDIAPAETFTTLQSEIGTLEYLVAVTYYYGEYPAQPHDLEPINEHVEDIRALLSTLLQQT
jgi:hypothetical protein